MIEAPSALAPMSGLRQYPKVRCWRCADIDYSSGENVCNGG